MTGRHQHMPYQLDGSWRTSAVILAAGRGERLGLGPKSAIALAGRPLLHHVVTAMAANDTVAEIVVTAPEDQLEQTAAMLRAARPPLPARVVAGGVTRQASVRAALAAVSAESGWVAITDVARPLVPRGTVDGLAAALRLAAREGRTPVQPCGAAPVVSVVDSVHLLAPDGRMLAGAVDRDRLRAAQTPQFFRRTCAVDAHEAAVRDGSLCTDDVGAMTRIGGVVVPAAGAPANIKITFEGDLGLAEALYARQAASQPAGAAQAEAGRIARSRR